MVVPTADSRVTHGNRLHSFALCCPLAAHLPARAHTHVQRIIQNTLQVRGDESMYEDDMSAPHDGAVWLIGEQRWSRGPPIENSS